MDGLFTIEKDIVKMNCPGCGYGNILTEMKWINGIAKCKKCKFRFVIDFLGNKKEGDRN